MNHTTEKLTIDLTRSEAVALTALLIESGRVLLANEITEAITQFDKPYRKTSR